jgi:hypothetical protein
MRRGIAIKGDGVRRLPFMPDRLLEEGLGCGHIACPAQPEVDGLPGFIHGSVEVYPLAAYLDRFLIPALLALFSLVFSRDVLFGIRHLNSEDLPGAYLSLGMLPLLLPSALVTMVKPRWGAPMLAVIGGLGLLGKIASPSTFRGPVFVGLGPLMYLVAFARWFGIHLVVAAGGI